MQAINQQIAVIISFFIVGMPVALQSFIVQKNRCLPSIAEISDKTDR